MLPFQGNQLTLLSWNKWRFQSLRLPQDCPRQRINKDTESAVAAAALYVLPDQKWLVDREDYLTRLTGSTKLVSQVMTTGMIKLKIANAGPEETGHYLNNLNQTLASLNQK